MNKTIVISLNEFPVTPNTLRADPAVDLAAPTTEVDLADLYHHYYHDKHGKQPPVPNPVHFEHLQYFRPEQEFRLNGDGLLCR